MTTTHDTDRVPEKYRPDPWIDATVGTRESTTKLSIATPTIPTRDWADLDEDDHVGFAPVSDSEVVFGESVPRILGEKTVREHGGNDRKTYLPRAVIDYLDLEPPARIRYHKPDLGETFPRVRVELIECGPGTEVPDYTACEKDTTHDRPSTYRWDGDDTDDDTTDDTTTTMLRRPRPDRQHSSPLDPSDLLDENGRVDHNKVRSRANRPRSDQTDVTDELCHRIRVMLTDGANREQVADEFGIAKSTVSHHAGGDCICTAEAEPREWTNGVGWHVRGESPRDDTETHPDQTALADGGTDATE